MTSFFTRSGDEGYTGILGEGKLPKSDLRLETLGTIDEANSALGMARALCKVPGLADLILRLQRDLYKMMAEAAATPENVERFHTIDERHIAWLELQIELIEKDLIIPKEFIVPGDAQAGASLDLARTIVRRAERRAVELLQRGGIENLNILKYLNRLSSLLYILELKEIQQAGNSDLSRAKTDAMIGTLINIVGVAVGGLLGTKLGSKLPERLSQTVVAGLGLFTVGFGLQMFLRTQNSLIVAGSLLVGALLGEWWQIENKLRNFGSWLEKIVIRGRPPDETGFVRGFLTASLVFCVGPMAILGSIQDGLKGDFQVLAIKSILDAFASLAFASSLGIGVIFSVIPLLIYQGGITLLAGQVQSFVTPAMMTEMSATGGLILVGLAISSLLEIKPIRAGNFLPALIVAPLIVWVLSKFGVM